MHSGYFEEVGFFLAPYCRKFQFIRLESQGKYFGDDDIVIMRLFFDILLYLVSVKQYTLEEER